MHAAGQSTPIEAEREAARADAAPMPRRDIQALRAVAVLAVVAYHYAPSRLPGGFVGVDVFFVISGFLITTHLMARPPARPADFARFWARRVLRLIPPVVIVILATLAATVLLLPAGLWRRLSVEGLTSMFYVQNWRLIADATDYLNAQAAPSPFQHFWSLSVEEQYYIGWPFLVALLGALSIRQRAARRPWIFFGGFLVPVLVSFGFGLALTFSAPATAYFSTFTRLWELGVGSLLAAAYPRWSAALRSRPGVRVGLLWGGLAGIVVACFVITGQTPFPGVAALLPTVACALVILADDPVHRLNPRRLSHSRPVQFVGDTSYALYLWHWPLIVLIPYAVNRPLLWGERIGVLVLALAAAAASTFALENPVRRTRFLLERSGRILLAGALASSLVVAAAVPILRRVDSATTTTADVIRAKGEAGDPCFGAGAADPANHCPANPPLLTTPEFAKADTSAALGACLNWPPYPKLITCTMGQTQAPTRTIALYGNSHAGHWLPALEELARRHRWRIDTFVIGVCQPSLHDQRLPGAMAGMTPERVRDRCREVQDEALGQLSSGRYDTVVMSTMDRFSDPAIFLDTFTRITSAGTRIMVIRDTPAPMDQQNWPPDCIARNLANPAACQGSPQAWVGRDALAEATQLAASAEIALVGVNHLLCTDTVCPPVLGGVIVYADYNHLTATMARTLAPYIEPTLLRLLG